MPRSRVASGRACSTFSEKEAFSTQSLGKPLLCCIVRWDLLTVEQGIPRELEILDGPEADRGLCWHRSYRTFLARRPPGSLDGPVLDVYPRLSISHPGKPPGDAYILMPDIDHRRLEARPPVWEIRRGEPKTENPCLLT